MISNDDRTELIALVREETSGNGLIIGALTAEYIADAIMAAGFKRADQ